MAWEIPGFSFSLPANADYSAESTYQFTPVTVVAASGAGINTDSALAPVAATGDPIIGILQNNPALAEAGTIVQNGISKVKLGGSVSVGNKLMAIPSGGAILAQTGYYSFGIALDTGVTGDIISVLLVNNAKLT